MKVLVGALALAAALWGVMFGLKWGIFWYDMTVAAWLLAGIALWRQKGRLREQFAFSGKHVVIGLASAVVLYFAFFAGDRISALLFSFAPAEVNGIYGMKSQLSPAIIAPLLFFLIAPAEEIFWRGFVQDRLAAKWGNATGWIVAGLLYGGMHIWAWNFILIMAALLCGLFWGAVYWKWKSLWPGIISHAVWDVTIFILLPVR